MQSNFAHTAFVCLPLAEVSHKTLFFAPFHLPYAARSQSYHSKIISAKKAMQYFASHDTPEVILVRDWCFVGLG